MILESPLEVVLHQFEEVECVYERWKLFPKAYGHPASIYFGGEGVFTSFFCPLEIKRWVIWPTFEVDK